MEAANGGWTVMDHLFISLSLSLFLVDRKIKGKKRKKKYQNGPDPLPQMKRTSSSETRSIECVHRKRERRRNKPVWW
jgi:hypothetical protein